jgi:predicted dienelactone hydrolase
MHYDGVFFSKQHLMKWILFIALMGAWISFGQYEIGETSIVFNDPDRDRDIETFIYYPANASGEEEPVSDGQFPVIAVGHGFVMSYTSYEYLWEHFVPLGYIVMLPNTETTVDVSHGDFGQDLGFIINAMQAEGENESSLFYEHLRVTSAVLGHSMGGGASVLAAAENPNISTLVTLAAAETDPSAIAAASSVTIPSLTFAGDADCVTPPSDHQELIYANLSDCKGYVLINEGTHCQFANSNPLCELGEFSCPSVDLEASDQHDIILTVLTPWLDAYLKNNFTSWEAVEALAGENEQYNFTLDCSENAPVLSASSQAINQVKIHPNPIEDNLYIANVPDEATYAIYTLDGRVLLSGKNQQSGINVSALPHGAYILRITSYDGFVFNQKVVKQ